MQQRDISWAQRAFCSQRANARNRGIAWEFTFEQWLAWWGDDIAYRGRSASSLQMQRIADQGAYSPDNTVKGTPARNRLTHKLQIRNQRQIANAKQHQANLDALPVVSDEGDPDESNPHGYALMWDRLERDSVRQSDKADEPSNTHVVYDRIIRNPVR